jgi:hypothetical protein
VLTIDDVTSDDTASDGFTLAKGSGAPVDRDSGVLFELPPPATDTSRQTQNGLRPMTTATELTNHWPLHGDPTRLTAAAAVLRAGDAAPRPLAVDATLDHFLHLCDNDLQLMKLDERQCRHVSAEQLSQFFVTGRAAPEDA